MGKSKILSSILAIWLAIISCNLPGGQSTQAVPQETSTGLSAEELAGTITALASNTQIVATTSTPIVAPITETVTVTPTLCTPSAVSNTNANVRSGPGTAYDIIGSITPGTTLTITGKNSDGTWWYIPYPSAPGGYAWIAGSVVTASCVPNSLTVVAAPPLPTPKPPTAVPTSIPANNPTAVPTSVVPTSVGPTLVGPTVVP